jgi:hypothetical protein
MEREREKCQGLYRVSLGRRRKTKVEDDCVVLYRVR